MNTSDNVAVCSRSFSRNPVLRSELLLRYSNVSFNDSGLQLEGPSLVSFLRGNQKAIIALETVDGELLEQLPGLKVISKYGVGLDSLDLRAMRHHGVRLGWEGGVNRRSVSELVLSSIIAMLRQVPAAHKDILTGVWRQRVGGNLTGKTVGIVGCGNIGKDLIDLLQPFKCSILVNDIVEYRDFFEKFHVMSVSLNELLASADIVTLHVPLVDSTRLMINEERLAIMKPSSVLVNFARGGLVDEAALKRALLQNRIAAAAFDVFGQEPPTDVELLQLPNFLSTPHIGGSSEESIIAMGRSAIRGLDCNHIP